MAFAMPLIANLKKEHLASPPTDTKDIMDMKKAILVDLTKQWTALTVNVPEVIILTLPRP
jgi:hypothetical protein